MNGLEIVTYVIIPGAMVLMVLTYILFNIDLIKLTFSSPLELGEEDDYLINDNQKIFLKIYFRYPEYNDFISSIEEYNGKVINKYMGDTDLIEEYSTSDELSPDDENVKFNIIQLNGKQYIQFKNFGEFYKL